MKINLVEKSLENVNADIEIVFINDIEKAEDKKLLETLEFKAKDESCVLLPELQKIYVGFEEKNYDCLAIASATAIKKIQSTKFKSAKINLCETLEDNLKAIVEGALLGEYKFTNYKSDSKKKKLDLSIMVSNKNNKLEKVLEEAKIISKAVNKTRDMVNTTPADFYPEVMANTAKKLAKDAGINFEVHGEKYLDKNGMNAMNSVGRASIHESKLIHLSYKPKEPKAKIVLVGKGLTYDSGGLSLKPSDFMVTMKSDKSGGCAVLSTLWAIAKLELPFEVHGIVGAVENMIGGDAYKPGDILKASNGKTIEVTNTDAEGRLVLADCLHFAQKNIKDFDYIFDFATLTGASIGAFGGYTTAVMGFNDKLKNKILKASKQSGELVGFLPFNDYMANLLKSETADFVNTSPNKNGGAITASLFLSKFIEDKNKKKWLHFDIAGPSYRKERWGVNPYGATGVAIRMMIKFMEEVIKKR